MPETGPTRLVSHSDSQPVSQTGWRPTTATSHLYNGISATLAFLIWGSWAYWVNSHAVSEGQTPPLVSALTQGIGSFVITLIMVRAVTWLFHRVPPATQLVLPALLTVLATGTCLAIAHSLVGTHDIARTVAPALTVAFLFNVYTAHKLRPTVKPTLEGRRECTDE